jgi:5-methylcytosine-specific restriction enzyme subunit McrC
MSQRSISIVEYEGFANKEAPAKNTEKFKLLPDNVFVALDAFASMESHSDLLTLGRVKGESKLVNVIKAKNYVGVITLPGMSIDILPKIYNLEKNTEKTKRIFHTMIQTLDRLPPIKELPDSFLQKEKMPLWEIFISMFVDEVTMLAKQGIKSAYTTVENNERFFKGKMMTVQNIKYNLINKTRFFVRYDEFSVDRPENRLLKSTVNLLRKLSNNETNKRNLIRLLMFFEGVTNSLNIDADFSKCISDRSMTHYKKALSWCDVFLRRMNFTSFSGENSAHALLFPMETVFESYIAAKVHKLASDYGFTVKTQGPKKSLFTEPDKFKMKPDITLTEVENKKNIVIMDTKWKLLTNKEYNCDISSNDMYQMYSYSKKYHAKKIVLLYPNTDTDTMKEARQTYKSNDSNDPVTVQIEFIDLSNTEEEITTILKNIKDCP